MEFAVIKTGGKQYRVAPGDIVSLEKIEGVNEGDEVVFDKVFLSVNDSAVKVGTPQVKGATVSGVVLEQGRGKKLHVIRFRAKSRYRRKLGHRQPFTKVRITKV